MNSINVDNVLIHVQRRCNLSMNYKEIYISNLSLNYREIYIHVHLKYKKNLSELPAKTIYSLNTQYNCLSCELQESEVDEDCYCRVVVAVELQLILSE
jgi:hypothetical protein